MNKTQIQKETGAARNSDPVEPATPQGQATRSEEQELEIRENFLRRILGKEPIYSTPPILPTQTPR